MGLTIHYALLLSGARTMDEVKVVVTRARELVLKQGMQEVTPLIRVGPDFMLGLYSLPVHDEQGAEVGHVAVSPAEGWVFSVALGAGAERLLMGLCRYPSNLRHEGRTLPTHVGRGWRFQFFCKTQYAAVQGWEHFLRSHRTAIELLLLWRELGVQVRITDEGGYWPCFNAIKLRAKLAQMEGITAAVAGALKDTAGADSRPLLTAASALGHPRFEQLEHEGMLRHGAQVRRAVRQIKALTPPPDKTGE
jgi:hypothetical protein